MEPLAHPKYSLGMLLEAKHLTLEHRYNALRMDTHDIRLHDFGTVCGLHVDKHPSPDCVNNYVILRPGIALDCCGREIVVPEDLYVPLFDGAKSGWCGAPVSEPPPSTLPTDTVVLARKTLYIYLRYQQCDTDPIPSYVRNCGCCGGSGSCGGQCQESDCVLSVTREGYEVSVSTVPPPTWRDPVSTAFCRWLAVQLKREQAGIADAREFIGTSLQHILCEAVTKPCADTCGGGNDELLLATVTFNSDDTLNDIDNCTNRRLVLSTGAIFESLECVVDAVIACCGQHVTQLPKLQLTGSVNPSSVDLSVEPLSTAIEYQAVATNSSGTDPTGPFVLQLLVDDSSLKVTGSRSSIGGNPGPAPTSATTSAGTTVSLAVSSLDKGSNATLIVDVDFDPAKVQNGDAVTSVASIAGYGGPADGPDNLTTTFTGQIRVDGPRVIFADPNGKAILPDSMTLAEVRTVLETGIEVQFDGTVDTSTTIALATVGNPADGTVGLAIVSKGTTATRRVPIAAKLIWPGARPATTTSIRVGAADIATVLKQLNEVGTGPVNVRVLPELSLELSLLGGSTKGAAATPRAAIKSPGPNPARLDGSPPKGGAPGRKSGESGDGTQGGDFLWSIAIMR